MVTMRSEPYKFGWEQFQDFFEYQNVVEAIVKQELGVIPPLETYWMHFAMLRASIHFFHTGERSYEELNLNIWKHFDSFKRDLKKDLRYAYLVDEDDLNNYWRFTGVAENHNFTEAECQDFITNKIKKYYPDAPLDQCYR